MGLQYLYTERSCIKIDGLINHFCTDTNLSREMRINLNWLQINTGTSIPILESTINTEYVEMNWFLSVQEFLVAINAKVHIPNLWTPSKSRVNDIILMDVVSQLDIPLSKKISFNTWRLFYRVNTLSDMTNSQGTHIQPRFLNKYGIDTYTPNSILQWPNQPPPAPKYYTNWIQVLHAVVGVDKDGKLHRPLGRWISTASSHIPSNVLFLLHKNKHILAVRDVNTNQWTSYLQSHQIRSTIYFDTESIVEMPSLDVHQYEKVDAIADNDYFKINTRTIKAIHRAQPTPMNNSNSTGIQEHVHHTNEWHTPMMIFGVA
jgi:hypothetical protein